MVIKRGGWLEGKARPVCLVSWWAEDERLEERSIHFAKYCPAILQKTLLHLGDMFLSKRSQNMYHGIITKSLNYIYELIERISKHLLK